MDARAQLEAWVRDGALPRDRLEDALQLAGARPTPAQWHAFVERLLTSLGAVLVAAALTYFVAANWDALGRFARFAMVEAALVAAVGIALWRGLDGVAGRASLLAAALVTGVLLALVGQVYQTGADTYELFAWWALLILPWTLVARQPALWMLVVALVDLAIVLYFRMSVARGLGTLDLLFTSRTSLWTVAAINAAALAAWEIVAAVRGGWWNVRWAPRLIAASVAAAVTFLAVEYALGLGSGAGAGALAAYAAFAAAMYWAYRVRTIDVVMLAGLVTSGIVLAAFAFARAIVPAGGVIALLLISVLIAGSAGLAAHWLRRLASGVGREPA